MMNNELSNGLTSSEGLPTSLSWMRLSPNHRDSVHRHQYAIASQRCLVAMNPAPIFDRNPERLDEKNGLDSDRLR